MYPDFCLYANVRGNQIEKDCLCIKNTLKTLYDNVTTFIHPPLAYCFYKAGVVNQAAQLITMVMLQ